MKITAQTIPPELADAYAKLIANKSPTGAGLIVARTTKKARSKAPTRPKSRELQDYEAAVDFLMQYLKTKTGITQTKTFRTAQIANLRRGFFDPDYWVKCSKSSTTILSNTPASGAFTGTRLYAYPDPNNQPSKALYGAGTISSGALTYSGATSSSIFKDLSLKWQRIVFSLKNKFTQSNEEPIFLQITGSIAASASTRASRAMLSLVIKRWIVSAGSTKITTTEAPVTQPISAYWRYRTPRGGSPYYAYTNQLKLMYSMRSKKYEEASAEMTQCVALIAPMPMEGKRYNNNTTVSTTLTLATVEAWQIKKTEPGWKRITPPAGIYGLVSITFTGTYFVASMYDPALPRAFFTRSTDGENWEKISAPIGCAANFGGADGQLPSSNIAANGAIVVSTGYYKNTLTGDYSECFLRSTDSGKTWGIVTPPNDSDDEYRGIAHNSSQFMALGFNENEGTFVTRSTDGITWGARQDITIYSQWAQTMNLSAANGNFFLTDIGSHPNQQIKISANGTTWTQKKTQTASSKNYLVTYFKGKYILGTDITSTGYLLSTDGQNWSTGIHQIMTYTAASATQFMDITMTYPQYSFYSEDLATFTQKPYGTGTNLSPTGIAAGMDIFVAVGGTGNTILKYAS